VGNQAHENLDVPHWPAANRYNFKEVWGQSSLRWLAILADAMERFCK
jgi:hypothetical protein